MLGGMITAARRSGVPRQNGGGTRRCHNLPLPDPSGASGALEAASLHHCAQGAQADEIVCAFGGMKQLFR